MPRRHPPCRSRSGESAMRAATQRPTRPLLKHPVVADLPPAEPEGSRRSVWSAEALYSTARANGCGGPESQGAIEFPEAQAEALTPPSRGAPFSYESGPFRGRVWGHPRTFFTGRSDWP